MVSIIEYSWLIGLLLLIGITWMINGMLRKKKGVATKVGKKEIKEHPKTIEELTLNLPINYRTSLEGHKLISGLWKEDLQLHKEGRAYCEKECENNLRNLIGIYQQIVDNPVIQEIEIKNPVFIVSWLRTGSTLLHNLVAVDPRNYAPYLWELLYPLPQTSGPNVKDISIRKELAHKEMEEFYTSGFEDFRRIHELRANYPDECCHIFERCFASRHIPIMGQCMQEYNEWFLNLTSHQIDNIYSLYKSELQNLTYNKRNYEVDKHDGHIQWFLKDETHMYFLENLLKMFPDARIINLHRDPVQVLGSTISGFHTIMKVYYKEEDIDGAKLARNCLEQMCVCKERLLNVRSRVTELTGREESDVFIDIKFEDLCLNPKSIVMDMYSKIGKNCTDTHLLEMITYLMNNPRHKHGVHKYNISEFGIDVREVRDRFQDYISLFLSK